MHRLNIVLQNIVNFFLFLRFFFVQKLGTNKAFDIPQEYEEDFVEDWTDLEKWNYYFEWGTCHPAHQFRWDKNYTNVENNSLVIKTGAEPSPCWYYNWEKDGEKTSEVRVKTTGMVETKRTFHYGFYVGEFEVTDSKSLNNAWWLTSTSSWPPEIDIFENTPTNKKPLWMTYHWGLQDFQYGNYFYKRLKPKNRRFQVALHWTPKFIKWYINGHLVQKAWTSIPQTPMTMIISNYISSQFGVLEHYDDFKCFWIKYYK